ncbi:hypothetical protein [Petropleomorpha daqingensis]|uniref:Uncharacterized protein n=1 Tax=Petropleomorpha daqingensis TaxID=2026353 RepID=A0A853CLR9_9ACTN|nr:hypothetical protein [Petropleomorpha daqingensis]NYJ08121.1 hypothetical protein [Petropleomorpha daqingensis]
MSRMRYKPSKPVAVFTAVVGAAMLVFGIVEFGSSGSGGGKAFLVVWCVFLVGMVSLNLWAAFSEKGSLATFTRVDDDPPSR